MLNNRSVKIKLEKDQPTTETQEVPDFAELIATAFVGLGGLVVLWVSSDTLRQILVHTAQVKIKP